MSSQDNKATIIKATVGIVVVFIGIVVLVISLIHIRIVTPPGFEIDMGGVRLLSSRQVTQCIGNGNAICDEAYVLNVIVMSNPNQGREIASFEVPLQ
jgi:hypothetical protein